ncbi:MAG: hypothetical protein KDH09_00625, partial [Chrysiogenetes bacterium]|nr:hypothetical protein [Chrysiogenetes bacterium]
MNVRCAMLLVIVLATCVGSCSPKSESRRFSAVRTGNLDDLEHQKSLFRTQGYRFNDHISPGDAVYRIFSVVSLSDRRSVVELRMLDGRTQVKWAAWVQVTGVHGAQRIPKVSHWVTLETQGLMANADQILDELDPAECRTNTITADGESYMIERRTGESSKAIMISNPEHNCELERRFEKLKSDCWHLAGQSKDPIHNL